MDTIIELRGVTYYYPLTKTPAVSGLNLRIERGKVYGVIGENGSGKTTFCALVRGFAPGFYQGELAGKYWLKEKTSQNMAVILRLRSAMYSRIRLIS